MEKYYQFFSALLAFIFFIPSYASLDLELTQGMIAATPVAIMPFTGEKVLASEGKTLSNLIKNDLQNSGQFRVFEPNSSNNANSVSESLQQINYNYWRGQKVNALLLGTIRSVGFGHYQVAITLVDIFGSDNVLLNHSFNIQAKKLRSLAHHISDLIYQKLTGIRGVFSTKIAYILVQSSPGKSNTYSLEVADADGFDPHPLLVSNMPIMSPTWSPDGQKIAYVSFEENHAAIYLQDLSTGKRRRISSAAGINGAPAFSPDGTRLALVLSKTGNPNIYVLDLPTGHLKAITKGWSIDTEPGWSSDGKSLLFTSNRDGTPQIYTYSFEKKEITRLTFQGDYNARASFSPDGHSIIMMHRENGLFGIACQDLTTGEVQILTQNGLDESPSLSPNGKMIIYATTHGDHGILGQVSLDGQIKLSLPSRDGIVQEPAWSPFLNS